LPHVGNTGLTPQTKKPTDTPIYRLPTDQWSNRPNKQPSDRLNSTQPLSSSNHLSG